MIVGRNEEGKRTNLIATVWEFNRLVPVIRCNPIVSTSIAFNAEKKQGRGREGEEGTSPTHLRR